jgi:hypothetical protein
MELAIRNIAADGLFKGAMPEAKALGRLRRTGRLAWGTQAIEVRVP